MIDNEEELEKLEDRKKKYEESIKNLRHTRSQLTEIINKKEKYFNKSNNQELKENISSELILENKINEIDDKIMDRVDELTRINERIIELKKTKNNKYKSTAV